MYFAVIRTDSLLLSHHRLGGHGIECRVGSEISQLALGNLSVILLLHITVWQWEEMECERV